MRPGFYVGVDIGHQHLLGGGEILNNQKWNAQPGGGQGRIGKCLHCTQDVGSRLPTKLATLNRATCTPTKVAR